MNRRDFIQNGSLAIGAAYAIKSPLELNPATNTGHYLTQSGTFKNNDLIVLTLLKSSNSNSDENAILSLRNQHNYFTELKYTNNDKFKLGFGSDVLNLFNTSSSLSLSFKTISQNNLAPNNLSKYALANLRSLGARSLLQSQNASQNDSLFCKNEYQFGLGMTYIQKIGANCDNPLTMMKAVDSNLLQLSSFFSGILRNLILNRGSNAINAILIQQFKSLFPSSNYSNYNDGKITSII